MNLSTIKYEINLKKTSKKIKYIIESRDEKNICKLHKKKLKKSKRKKVDAHHYPKFLNKVSKIWYTRKHEDFLALSPQES